MPKSSRPPRRRSSGSLVPVKPSSASLTVPRRLILGDHEIHVEEMLRIPDRHPHGDGPWHNEPDRVAWIDASTNYPCLILRQPSGVLAGYVAVGPSHPLWCYERDAIPTSLCITPHRGINYAALCEETEPPAVRICHPHEHHFDPRAHRPQVPSERDSDAVATRDAWWFGFTCDHVGDLMPKGYSRNDEDREDGPRVYRDIAYVAEQTLSLARQLKALEGGTPIGGTPVDAGVPLSLENKAQARLPGKGGRHA